MTAESQITVSYSTSFTIAQPASTDVESNSNGKGPCTRGRQNLLFRHLHLRRMA